MEITDVRTLGEETPDVRTMEFHNTPVAIGSHTGSVVQLPDTDIAPYHAMLLPVGEDQWVYQPTVVDGKATINEQPVDGRVELEDGDIIEITHFSIKFTLDMAPELVLPEPGNVGELARIRDYPLPPRSEVRKPDYDVSLNLSRQKTLASFALELRSCRDFAGLLECTVGMLLGAFGARTVWMGLRRDALGPLESVHGRSDQGENITEPKKIDTFTYRCLTRHQFIRISRTGDRETQSVLAVPILGERGALGLIHADTRRRRHVFDDADLDFVTMVSNLLVPHLEAIIGEQLDQRTELQAREVALLQAVQAQLDPHSVPHWPELQVAAYAKPGFEQVGDIYDIMRLPNGLAALLIGHVRASTTRAALAMTEVRSAFRIAGLHADPPHIQVKALNWLLFDEKDPCALDIAVVVTNPKTGAAEFCTAGDIGALIVDSRGNPRNLRNQDAPPVGTARGFEYRGSSERIRSQEILALYTAGCVAARDASGEAMGEGRFIDALCDGFGQPASAALDALLADHAAFLKDGRPPADITILLVHRTTVTSA